MSAKHNTLLSQTLVMLILKQLTTARALHRIALQHENLELLHSSYAGVDCVRGREGGREEGREGGEGCPTAPATTSRTADTCRLETKKEERQPTNPLDHEGDLQLFKTKKTYRGFISLFHQNSQSIKYHSVLCSNVSFALQT